MEKLFHKLIDLLKSKEEVISYLFWGVVTTVVNWGVYSVCVKFLGMSIAVANFIAWVLAVLVAYVSNKLLVFKSRSWELGLVIRELSMFLSARIATGAMEIVLVPALVSLGLNGQIAGVKGAVAKVLVSVLVVILNYVFSKLLIFKKKQ
ncbi:MAG: GtrA family protein [Lachnospiraceae bacterium]|nr:GtrA family protein [Lachnospiraceae bacterium]